MAKVQNRQEIELNSHRPKEDELKWSPNMPE
jgi:hypothetical protein